MALPTYDPPWLRTVDLGDERRALIDWWHHPHRFVRAVRAYHALLAAAPAAIAYSFTLFVTWWTLRGASDMVGRRLILSASTNLRNLQRDPIQVLLASAFWTDGGFPWAEILIILTVGAVAERWLGSLRWIMVVAIGHIGATLLTALGLARALDRDLIPVRVVMATDVGPSYGIAAILGALAFRLRGRARLIWAAVMLLWYGSLLGVSHTFTDYGHFFALVIGLLTGGTAVFIARRLVTVMRRRSAPTTEKRSGHDRVDDLPVALHEPHGGFDQARGDRPEYGHQ